MYNKKYCIKVIKDILYIRPYLNDHHVIDPEVEMIYRGLSKISPTWLNIRILVTYVRRYRDVVVMSFNSLKF